APGTDRLRHRLTALLLGSFLEVGGREEVDRVVAAARRVFPPARARELHTRSSPEGARRDSPRGGRSRERHTPPVSACGVSRWRAALPGLRAQRPQPPPSAPSRRPRGPAPWC